MSARSRAWAWAAGPLVRADDLSRVNQAFFQVNAVISLGLFVLVLVQLAVGAASSGGG